MKELNIKKILDILRSAPIISSWEVLNADEIAKRSYYKIRCSLVVSGFYLEMRFIRLEKEVIYSYQLFSQRPLLRWDNAPHYPNISSFPHHFHQVNGRITESDLTGDSLKDLPKVLKQITEFIILLQK